MINLENVTLLAMDGAGNNNFITKCLHLSSQNIIFKDVVLLSPTTYPDLDGINLIKINKLTHDDWNKFVLKDLHNYIQTSHYLFVDSDGFVLNPDLWTDEFLEYDYIGAPWRYPDHIFTDKVYESVKRKRKDDINLVGNGGFTLRSKKLLIATSKCLDTKYNPEDVYICMNNYDFMIEQGIKFAPVELARRFSQDPLVNHSSTFGFHGNKEYIKGI